MRGLRARLKDSLVAVGREFSLSAKVGLSMLSRRGGEPGMARLIGPYGTGGYGWQPLSKSEQILHFREWHYTCINYIASQVAEKPPVAVSTVPSEEAEKYAHLKRKSLLGKGPPPPSRKIVPPWWKAKAQGPQHPGEEFEFLADDDPLNRLLRNPNDPDTGVSFWYEATLFNCLTGDDYLWVVDEGGELSLWVIPSHWVTPRCEGKEKVVDYFEVSPRGSAEGMVRFAPEEIIWTKYPSPLGKLAPQSQLQAMATTSDTYDKTIQARNFGIDNGVQVSGVLQLPPTMEDPVPATLERIESRFSAKYAGVFNYGRPLILAPGMTWVPPPADKELAFLQSAEQARKWIIAQWGLDETVLGFGDSAAWAAIVANIRNTNRVAINSRKRFRAEVLTEKLAKRFGDDRRILWPENDPVDPGERRADFQVAVQANAASANDVRVHLLELESWPEEIYDRPLVQPGLANPGTMDAAGWDQEGGGFGEQPAGERESDAGDDSAGDFFGGADTDSATDPSDVAADFKSLLELRHGPPPRPGLVFDEGTHRWVRPADRTPGEPKPAAGSSPRDATAGPEEHKASKKLAAAKIKACPVPPPEKIAKMRAELAKARDGGRPGGDARGSSKDRRVRRRKLFTEWGGDEKGYVVCHETGLKMHWSADPKENPHRYPLFEQGKIFTAYQGGGYQMPNLIPESFETNRARNDKPVRKENLR